MFKRFPCPGWAISNRMKQNLALRALNMAIAIHDVTLSSAGADDVAAIARALFVAMVNARRDPPDAAQRHEAEQTALIDPDRIG